MIETTESEGVLQEFTLDVELSLRSSLCCESFLLVQRSVLMSHCGVMFFLVSSTCWETEPTSGLSCAPSKNEKSFVACA